MQKFNKGVAFAGLLLAAALAGCGAPSAPSVEAPKAAEAAPVESFATVQAACLAAVAPEGDPTGFACDWLAIARLRPPANLSRRYAAAAPGVTGDLAVLESEDGAARIAISTVTEPSLHTCTLAMTGKRGADGALEATDPDNPACAVRVTPAAKGVDVSSAGDCSFSCGARGVFAGPYAAPAS